VGVKCVVIPNVLEDRQDISHIEAGTPGAVVTVVCLTAPIETIHDRIRGREKSEQSLAWHLNRAVELSNKLEGRNVEDFTVNTDGKTLAEIAKEVLETADWPKFS
jgi:adenylylsulfate kinase